MNNVEMNEAANDAKNAQAGQQLLDDPDLPAPRDDKALLHWRIEVRMGELERMLASVEMPSDRGHELVASLEFARRHMRGDFSRISESVVAELSDWLDRSETLRVTSPGLPTLQQE